jgi:hypothetical protein
MEKKETLPPFLILLAAEEKTFPYIELHKRMSKAALGYELPLFWVPKFMAKLGSLFLIHSFIKPFMIDIADLHYDVDISRAKKLLGWEPKKSLDKNLETLVAWAKENKQEFYKENGLIVPKKLEKEWGRQDAQKKSN